jgi:hypothetical protein
MLLHRTHGIHVPAHEFSSLQVRLFRSDYCCSGDLELWNTAGAHSLQGNWRDFEKNDLVFVCAHDAYSDISAAACCMQRDANLLQLRVRANEMRNISQGYYELTTVGASWLHRNPAGVGVYSITHCTIFSGETKTTKTANMPYNPCSSALGIWAFLSFFLTCSGHKEADYFLLVRCSSCSSCRNMEVRNPVNVDFRVLSSVHCVLSVFAFVHKFFLYLAKDAL